MTPEDTILYQKQNKMLFLLTIIFTFDLNNPNLTMSDKELNEKI
jgi:hypothetical protein